MRSHRSVKARILHTSSTKRMPAFTKKEMEPNTWSNWSALTWPLSRTASRTSIAVAREKAISWTGVAPASCRWYEHTFMGFHFGAFCAHQATMSTINRFDGAGGKMYVPRDRYSFTMSFWVVPRSSRESTPCSRAFATYSASIHAAVALIVMDVFIFPGGMESRSVRMWPRCETGTPTLPTSPWARMWSGS